jgi:DNA adenine methylase
VLRYHGGKWRLADWIVAHLPPHHCYVEPFGGAASVLMRKPRSAVEVYNDLDASVVSLFRVLRDPVTAEQLRAALELTPYSRAEFVLAWEPSEDPVEDARRLLVRSSQSIGAKKRCSRNGWRAGPTHGSPVNMWTGWPSHVPSFVARLREVLIEQQPAAAVVAQFDSPATLFYVDPPYVLKTRAWDHRKIYAHELTDAEHAELLTQLLAVRGMVLVSGYRSPLYDEFLAGWRRVDVNARAQGNRPRVESLWISPAADALLRQPALALEARHAP